MAGPSGTRRTGPQQEEGVPMPDEEPCGTVAASHPRDRRVLTFQAEATHPQRDGVDPGPDHRDGAVTMP